MMAVLTVRNVPEEVHRALRMRAAEHGRSTEAEVRAILAQAVSPESRLLMGDALMNIGRRFHLSDEDVESMSQAHDQKPAEPMGFE
ncbi:Arc family DNA-binding protein [Pseudomonas sp. RC10]|uniref:FitA-like ribbon-helix-helix domain-containing protein n=1 Tax=Pseudomonas bambusae TaxID=3139142 RepID=UPI003138ACD1